MKKCKQASSVETCDKGMCCYYCEDSLTCADACGNFDDKAELEEQGCEYQFDEETALQEFTSNALTVMKEIAAINSQKKMLEEQEKKVRMTLEAAMDQYGIKSFDNDILKVTYVAPTTKTSVDSAKLKKEYPEIFKKCSKTSDVKGSVRITVK